MKEKHTSFKKEEEERMDTHAKEQPFTVINNNNKKCMARNYAQSPFQVTVHQQAGHSESPSPSGCSSDVSCVLQKLYLGLRPVGSQLKLSWHSAHEGNSRKMPVILLWTSSWKCPTKLLWPFQVTSSQDLQQPLLFPFVILFKLWILNWL